MKKSVIFGLMLLPGLLCLGQGQTQQPPATRQQTTTAGQTQRVPEDSTVRMTHFQTEIWDPEIPMVQPAAKIGDPPADAIILFDGTDINKEWEETARGGVKPATWVIKDGAMVSVKGSGSLKTKRVFNDFQLHMEWKTPSEITGSSQGRGNSGVYLQDLYEVQILDSWHNRTYRNGQAGAFYKQYATIGKCQQKTRRMADLRYRVYCTPLWQRQLYLFYSAKGNRFSQWHINSEQCSFTWSDYVCWNSGISYQETWCRQYTVAAACKIR